MENWKPVPIEEFKDLYEVSDTGKVRYLGNGLAGGRGRYLGELKQTPQKKNGYIHLRLCNKGFSKDLKLHRLVALAFLPKIEGRDIVDHIDRDKTNNNVNNLRWANAQESSMNRSCFRGTTISKTIRKDNCKTVYTISYYDGLIRKQKQLMNKDEAFSLFLEKGGDNIHLNDF